MDGLVGRLGNVDFVADDTAYAAAMPDVTGLQVNDAVKVAGVDVGKVHWALLSGASALVGPLRVPDSLLEFALPLMLIATLLGFFMIMEKEMTKWEGWLSLLFYIFFLGTRFNLL